MTASADDWISRRHRNPSAAIRLFCLPHAGGGSTGFSSWAALFGPDVDVCPVLLPGREQRIMEEPVADMAELLTALTAGLATELDRPYALFGHSMGANIAFALAERLVGGGRRPPVRLFLSAARPAGRRDRAPRHRLSDAELIESLRRLNGGRPGFYDEPELVELLLPVVRADLTLIETYTVPAGVRLPVPITAFAGDRDPSTGPADVGRWAQHTTAGFTLHVLPGGHFFADDPVPLVERIARDLRAHRGNRPA